MERQYTTKEARYKRPIGCVTSQGVLSPHHIHTKYVGIGDATVNRMKSGQTVVMLKYNERNDMRHHGDEKLAETIGKRKENARGNKL